MDEPGISRELAARYGRQAAEIIESGEYVSPSGRVVQIGHRVKRSVEGTVSYPPDRPFQESARGPFATGITVQNTTTLEAARTLIVAGDFPAVLNFASATHPGGGFLSGARAQEESLARSSALYACIRNDPMYVFHRSLRDPLYTNYAIYSPDVPVFRADDGSLLEGPYTVAIITSPAVNAVRLDPARRNEIGPAMWRRILKVLSIGLHHGHDALVLGAWGCGAFGNDGREIAGLFHRALEDNFKGAFRHIVFAVLDRSRGRKVIGPFREAFEGEVGSRDSGRF